MIHKIIFTLLFMLPFTLFAQGDIQSGLDDLTSKLDIVKNFVTGTGFNAFCLIAIFVLGGMSLWLQEYKRKFMYGIALVVLIWVVPQFLGVN